MLGILTYVEREGEASVDELAAHFGVSPAQIRRDVELLWVSGVPGHAPQDLIDFDGWAFDEGVVRLINSQGVGQVRLSPREGVALIGALSAVVAGGVAPEAAHTALAKLIDAVGDKDAVRSVTTGSVDPAVVAVLRESIDRRVVVGVGYVDANDRSTSRVIEPHRMVVIDGTPYVECYCRRAEDYRTLRVDRILSPSLGDEPIVTPPSESSGFSLVAHFEAVVVADVDARWLFESFPGVRLEESEGTITARFGVADVSAIAGQLMTVGTALKSVEPQQLANELARQARAVLAAQA
nr:WYL domain-containing protein [Demequina sp. TTPB684]